VVPQEEISPTLAAVLEEARQDPAHKVLVFFVAAMVVQVHTELFRAMGWDILEMHSRHTQAYRMRVAEAFRNNPGQIMFTSDVSARGLDYPDISLVVQ
ncbi:unnamed protein product, partial [Discosporangium mesarthrocarpum]